MIWSVNYAEKSCKTAETPHGKGLTTTITVTIRDSGVTEVNGTPVWSAHPELGGTQAVMSLLAEFRKVANNRATSLKEEL